MDKIPAFVCRVKGDATSWRKVLFVDPWWPREDLWHLLDTKENSFYQKMNAFELLDLAYRRQAFGMYMLHLARVSRIALRVKHLLF
jgi:hypothetical protein